MKNISPTYNSLLTEIGTLLEASRQKAGKVINTILVQTYWQVGRHIVEFEQGGEEKAKFGTELMDRLSQDLSEAYGKGFSRSNLSYIRKFYLYFPIRETVSHELSWSHYFEILKAENELLPETMRARKLERTRAETPNEEHAFSPAGP